LLNHHHGPLLPPLFLVPLFKASRICLVLFWSATNSCDVASPPPFFPSCVITSQAHIRLSPHAKRSRPAGRPAARLLHGCDRVPWRRRLRRLRTSNPPIAPSPSPSLVTWNVRPARPQHFRHRLQDTPAPTT
ncbi:hypothetical protein GALMADRAFT_157411, partial [Galerina marginata CBS 339.88]